MLRQGDDRLLAVYWNWLTTGYSGFGAGTDKCLATAR